ARVPRRRRLPAGVAGENGDGRTRLRPARAAVLPSRGAPGPHSPGRPIALAPTPPLGRDPESLRRGAVVGGAPRPPPSARARLADRAEARRRRRAARPRAAVPGVRGGGGERGIRPVGARSGEDAQPGASGRELPALFRATRVLVLPAGLPLGR